MSKEKELFNMIVNLVRHKDFYIPRNYQTVGGMWTVDTYKRDNVTVQILDEGCITKLSAPDVLVLDSGNSFKVERGGLQELQSALDSLKTPFE